MENKINRLIWESKKRGKPVNPWAICTSSVGREDKTKYERCVKDVKKKSPIKENYEEWSDILNDIQKRCYKKCSDSNPCVQACLKNNGFYDYSQEEHDSVDINQLFKENRINEYGGYDDPGMYAQHAGAYMGQIKTQYNTIVTSLQTLDKLLGDVFDDQLRKELGDFLNSMDEPLKKLAKAATEAEKKHLNNLRGGRPTPREDMGTEE